jgi:hypothetical protein
MPVLKSSIRIQGDYQLTASSQLLADPLLVIHFVLVSIPSRGNPARLISEVLGGFLPEQSFAYEEIVFDLGSDRLVRNHTDAMTVLVRALER